jgi:hypothetical protein
LNVSPNDPIGQGFDGLATALHQQALQIHLGPVTPLTTAKRGAYISQKPIQSFIQRANFFGSHQAKLPKKDRQVNILNLVLLGEDARAALSTALAPEKDSPK